MSVEQLTHCEQTLDPEDWGDSHDLACEVIDATVADLGGRSERDGWRSPADRDKAPFCAPLVAENPRSVTACGPPAAETATLPPAVACETPDVATVHFNHACWAMSEVYGAARSSCAASSSGGTAACAYPVATSI
jgi:hypothetical protein